MTRRRSLVLAIAITTVAVTGCAPSTDTLISGRFGPSNPVVLDNLTIADGSYIVSYSLSAFVSAKGAPASVSCGVVDTSGRIAFFAGMTRVADSSGWVELAAAGRFDLPELTLGLRCFAEREAAIDMVVRDVSLLATAVD